MVHVRPPTMDDALAVTNKQRKIKKRAQPELPPEQEQITEDNVFV
jgi:hypothetical protein